MPDRRSFLAALGAASFLPGAALSAPSIIRNERTVATIRVLKGSRKLELIGGARTVLKTFPVRLGKSPVGPKRWRGDGRTPEGVYRISARNPNSSYHLSLRVDYPSREDRASAARLGRDPGGDIMLHGQPNWAKSTLDRDWTEGCVALSNAHMEEVWRYIPVGCPVVIRP